MSNHPTLFSPCKLGQLELPNRIVMAPMTRSRAIGNVPNALMAEYYGQRAAAGLIITEGIAPSPDGLGYARIPGLFNEAQVAGWQHITRAVHDKGGRIFAQLMHTGRISHPFNQPQGARVVAPSAVPAAATQLWTDQQQLQALPTPEAIADIPALIAGYVQAARNAVAAGFDGVEIHAANGYLPMQFLNTASNQRSDAYGGSPAARNRFVLELVDAIAGAIGSERTGIRLSPYNNYNDMATHEEDAAQYTDLAKQLGRAKPAYVHLLNAGIPERVLDAYREHVETVMLNGNYTADRAEADLAAGKAQLISFGSAFLANPDLPERIRQGAPLNKPDQATFYTPGEQGYTDYPTL